MNAQRARIHQVIKTNKKGELFGPLLELIHYFLLATPYANRHVEDRAYEMFNKQTPGLIGRDSRHYNIVRVRIKPFRQWVRQNASRLVSSKKAEAAYAAMMQRVEEDSQHELGRILEDELKRPGG